MKHLESELYNLKSCNYNLKYKDGEILEGLADFEEEFEGLM